MSEVEQVVRRIYSKIVTGHSQYLLHTRSLTPIVTVNGSRCLFAIQSLVVFEIVLKEVLMTRFPGQIFVPDEFSSRDSVSDIVKVLETRFISFVVSKLLHFPEIRVPA